MQTSLTPEELKAISVEKNEADSTVTITGEIPYTYLEQHRSSALKKLGANVELDGFRKGHAPEKMLIEHVGEMHLLGEMAERALAAVYPAVVAEHKLDVIGYPQINLTKLAKDNPLGFTATVAIVPKFDLPDYTHIAADINKDKESKDVTDEEVAKQIEEIQRQKMAYERMQQKAQPQEDGAEEAPLETEEDFKKLPLPELTDEYVKTLGQPGQFETVEDFKKKLKEHLAIEKDRDVDAKHRAKITDVIVEKTEVTLPQVLIDAELNQMFAQMEDDLKRAELNMEDYLTHIKKTKEDLVTDWKPAAEKRAKLQLVLNAITEKEGIEPKKEEIDHQVGQLMEQHKDADEARVRIYVTSVLANEEVMKMLEAA